MPPRTLVIVNPASRNGATRKTFLRLEEGLRSRFGSLEIDWTKAPRDAERLAREGVRAGIERILVAGGDGTASEVVAGIMAAGMGDEVEVGLLPFGTGADLRRGLGQSADMQAAIEEIAAGQTRRIDVGRLVYQNHEGAERTTHFVNSATIGISGLICKLVNETTKRFGGTVSFLVGTIRAILQFQPQPIQLHLDGELVYDGDIILATANNGLYFGGGMRGTPKARFDDGLLDVMVIPGMTKSALLTRIPKLYPGTHIEVPGVLYFQGQSLEVRRPTQPHNSAPNQDIAPVHNIEVDGEPLGVTPAHFEVVADAITLVGAGGSFS